MASYGSTQTIITREGATPETFGFATESDPAGALEQFVDDLRERASSEVERYCEREFTLQTGETEILYGDGSDTIRLQHYPIVTINSIQVGATTLDSDVYQVESLPGQSDMNAGIVERVDRRVWPDRKITVDYDWGFESPPGVVKAVVEDMVVEVLEKAAADRKSSAKSSESMDGYSVSWQNSDPGAYLTLDENKRQRLQQLKRQGVA